MENIACLGFSVKNQDGIARGQALIDLAHLGFHGHLKGPVIRTFPGDKFLYHALECLFAQLIMGNSENRHPGINQ